MADSAADLKNIPAVVHAMGFSPRKKSILKRFLGNRKIIFVNAADRIPAGGTALVWGRAPVEVNDNAPVNIIRVEDGFIRSVGLGAGLTPPLSWVFDPVGIYFDATGPSLLERLIAETEFTDGMRERAAALRERIVAAGVTKYNTGDAAWTRPDTDKRVILVPGQVETDASIRFGSPEIKSNIDLLRAVRENAPDACIVYKPHPDVVAGLRLAGKDEDAAKRYCDEIVTDAPTGQMLGSVDAVHTMTSLMGFEALMRGIPVTCYGAPFYAGWGLTTDVCAQAARRKKRVSLDEMVYAALVLYPEYRDPETGRPATPEDAVEHITRWKTRAALPAPFHKRVFSSILNFILKRRAY